MNKEILIAVAIGIVIGIGGAVFLNRNTLLGSFKGTKTPSSVTGVATIPNPGTIMKTEFSGMKSDGSVVNDGTLSIEVKPVKSNPIVFQTLNDVTVREESKPYIVKLKLKPGYNEIRTVELADRGTTVDVSTLFYLPNNTIASRTAALESITAKDSTASAENELKEKLEKKVIELRYNAKKAVYGTVDESTKNIITVSTPQGKRSIAVEPEVTRYYQVTGYELKEIDVDTIRKGDRVSVFISTIGSDEKSYTVYREPNLQMVTGKVAQISAPNYQITAVNLSKESAAYDVESSTVQQVWNSKTGTYDKIGFSKLSVGDALFGTYTSSSSTRSLSFYVAVPRYFFPQVVYNPPMGVIVRLHKDTVSVTGREQQGEMVLVKSRQLASAYESAVEVSVSEALHTPPKDIYKYISVELGSVVQEGDCLAQKSGLLKKIRVLAPKTGEVRKIDHSEGTITLIEKTSKTHTFDVSGIWRGTEGNEILLELTGGIAIPITRPHSQSISGRVLYCEDESTIDESFAGTVVVAMCTNSVAISRLCAFEPNALIVSTTLYQSTLVPQFIVKDTDLDTIMKKRYNTLLYIPGSAVIYMYNSNK